MQAIEVRFLAATNTKGTRIKAICRAGTHTTSRRYGLEVEEDEFRVVKELCEKLGWENLVKRLIRGSLANGNTVYSLLMIKNRSI